MDFYERFELLDLVKDDGIKTFEAREIATQRPVRVHLFVAPKAPLQAALLKALDQMPESEKQRIIDRGKNEGTPYLVTDRLLDHQSLQDWVLNTTHAASHARTDVPVPSGSPQPDKPVIPSPVFSKTDLSAAGAWKIPLDLSPPASSVPSATIEPSELRPVHAESLDQQFSNLFEPGDRLASPVNPARIDDPAIGEIQKKTEASNVAGQMPASEFTRMFQVPAAPVASDTAVSFAETPSSPPAEIPLVEGPSTKARQATKFPEPGEFTRMFQSPSIKPAAPAPAPTSKAPKSTEPGEFTRMFQTSGTAPGTLPSAPKKLSGTGEFTRMFQTPASGATGAPPAPAARTSPSDLGSPGLTNSESTGPNPSEFTRYFETPSPAGPMPRTLAPQNPGTVAQSRVGEFTRMFGQNELPPRPTDLTSDNTGQNTGAPLVSSDVTPSNAAPSPTFPSSRADSTSGNSATQAFSLTKESAPLPPVSTEPGEYTRMISLPTELTLGQAPVAPPAQAATTQQAGGFPVLSIQPPSIQPPSISPPAIPQLAIPQAAVPEMPVPQVAAPQVSIPQPVLPPFALPPASQPSAPQPAGPVLSGAPAPTSYLPLILGISVIVILAIVIILFFALR